MIRIADMMNLAGRTALITGAAGRLGRAFAHALAEMGAELILTDRRKTELDSLREELEATWSRPGFQAVGTDLAEEEQLRDLIAQVNVRPKPVDILINNAAFVGLSDLSGWATTFDKQSWPTWKSAVELNLGLPFLLSQGIAASLAASGHGSIVNIGSIYGVLAPDYSLYEGTQMGNPAAYAASKGGLVQLTRWLATTLAPKVRVNCVSPGGIHSGQPETFVRRYEARTPLGRMGRPDDITGAVVYLASDLSIYVTGQNLLVDGGWSAW